MCTTRLENLWNSLQRIGLHNFKKTFVDPDYECIHVNHYLDHDVYVVDSDGNHRTTWAKIIKAPYIRAYVTSYRLNKDAYIRYERDNIQRKKYNKKLGHLKGRFFALIRELGLTHSDSNLYFQDKLISKDFSFPDFQYWDIDFSFKFAQEQISEYCQIISQVRTLKMYIEKLKFPVRMFVLWCWRIEQVKQLFRDNYVNLMSFTIFFKLLSAQEKKRG
ncbi:hypothetical protein [Shimazuella kribbensis]|uniref:hypothetical protein n=1 Tax=Shimazuella kribbensis TaxID=139808 RepID=UPI001470C158|nr:hypothetical protein [Shimazuella kribbensis]